MGKYWTHCSHFEHFTLTIKTIWIGSPATWIKICNRITQKTWTAWHHKHEPQIHWFRFQQRIYTRFNRIRQQPPHTHTHTLSRRYIRVFTNLTKNKNIFLTSPDNGGGIAILDTVDYHKRRINLLNDQNTYIPISLYNINKNIEISDKSHKNNLKRIQTMVPIIKLPPTYPYDLRTP